MDLGFQELMEASKLLLSSQPTHTCLPYPQGSQKILDASGPSCLPTFIWPAQTPIPKAMTECYLPLSTSMLLQSPF